MYLVSELVRGRTLAQLIEDGELSDRDVLRIGVALCDALEHAHGRGVVHRDVKPGNVIVPDDPAAGVAKLTDFGIARVLGDDALTRTGDVVGTLAYMAPEQAEGRQSGEAADLYSLAIVLYEALAGVNPVRGRGPAATARRVGARLPPLARLRRDLPPGLCEAIDVAVLPRPEQRGTLADLRAALQDATRESPTRRAPSCRRAPRRSAASASPRCRAARRTGSLAALRARPRWSRGALRGSGRRRSCSPDRRRGRGRDRAPCCRGWVDRLAVLLVSWLSVPAAGSRRRRDGGGPVPVLLRRARGSWWSAPALAAPLDVISGGAAWLSIAGQAARPWHRAALGALGWWAVLAARVLGHGRASVGRRLGRRLARGGVARRGATGRCSRWPAYGRWRRWRCRFSCAERRSPTTCSAPSHGRRGWRPARRLLRRTWAPLCLARRSPGYLRCSFARRARPSLRSMRRRHAATGVPVVMSVLRSLEEKIAGLVEGAFGRAFRSQVRPVELARKLAREMDEHRTVSVSRTYVPNEYAIWLSPEDRQRYEGVEHEVIDELSAYLLEHARRERLAMVSRPVIEFRTDERLHLGEFGIQARAGASPEGEAAKQADHGHTMVYSTSERSQESLTEARADRAGRAILQAEGRRL